MLMTGTENLLQDHKKNTDSWINGGINRCVIKQVLQNVNDGTAPTPHYVKFFLHCMYI